MFTRTRPPHIAFPFAFDQNEAIRIGGWYKFRGFPTKPLKSLCPVFLPWLGVQPEQPTRIAAAYLPGWIVDADVGVKIWSMRGEEESKRQGVIARFKNSYMPGFAYDPLSQLSIKDRNDRSDVPFNTVPWSPDLQRQHGLDIACLPYTMTPFSLVDAARSLSYSDAGITDIRFDPTSVESIFCAAYPVLVPVYILQYDASPFQDMAENVNVMIHASELHGARGAVENMLLKVPGIEVDDDSLWSMFKCDLLHIDRHAMFAFPVATFANLQRLLVLPKNSRRDNLIEFWINLLGSRTHAFEKYQAFEQEQRVKAAGSSEIDWNDLRIRQYIEEEVQAVSTYMGLGAEYALLQSMASTLEHVSGKVVTVSINTTRSKSAADSPRTGIQVGQTDEVVKDIMARMKQVMARRQEAKPQWLKDYDAQQQGQGQNTSTNETEGPASATEEDSTTEKKAPEAKTEETEETGQSSEAAGEKKSEVQAAKEEKKPEEQSARKEQKLEEQSAEEEKKSEEGSKDSETKLKP
ncbi:hypothetical protein NM688_g4802 [Phlebia brevispora]|uniref:Uncharacterized protein n=1 Tax=Phlebia brevispora TaxID=194682 RepID=A0ACC1T233_9APHY|nr:hypothetical protein NM688_g4802 [Phlebia brevispora]